MAQNLGMSRLGAEQQAENGKPLSTWTGRWESLIQREVGRRIWWNLVFLEWSLAPSYSFSTSYVCSLSLGAVLTIQNNSRSEYVFWVTEWMNSS